MPDPGHREFKVLTEHEVARSLTAIEEVGRSGRPVAEIGQRHVGSGRLDDLREDLERCLEMAVEEGVRGFIRKVGSKRVTYGFFKQAWVLAALQFLDHPHPDFDAFHLNWIQGLLFGYQADAIERLLVVGSSPPRRVEHPAARVTSTANVRIVDTESGPRPGHS